VTSLFLQSRRQLESSDAGGNYSRPELNDGMFVFQKAQVSGDLFDVFSCLSEVFIQSVRSGLPEWIALPGKEWPLFEACARLASELEIPKLNQCTSALSEVPISTLDSRSDEYDKLFVGEGSPPIWLYESHYVGGRVFGPTSNSILNIYREAGLEIIGSELADHAGLELAFLAFLVGKEITDLEFCNEWKLARDMFARNHAGRWLPEVGKQISRSIDPAWSSIGLLISAIFSPAVDHTARINVVPGIVETELCTLCGFCVQACPTNALRILEDEKRTSLLLETSICNSCKKCRNICPEEVISFSAALPNQTQVLLRESPRARCSICGETTYSQAELEYTQRILGNPDWLAYCLNCRSQHIRKLN